MTDDSVNLIDTLRAFFERSAQPVLFVGAGVSVKAGLPTWTKYLSDIAVSVKVYDSATARIMATRISEMNLAKAASLFYLATGVTPNKQSELLTDPFEHYDASQIEPIVRLPFQFIVTTNYDRALLDAYASVHGKSALEVNLGDRTLASAPFQKSFYVARIHGRVEVSDTMILSDEHFRKVSNDPHYQSFLAHTFSHCQVLFVGYSFNDPAIVGVFNTLRKTVGSIHAGNHLAVVPDNIGVELSDLLTDNNVELAKYDSSSHHRALWDVLTALDRTIMVADDSDDIGDTGSYMRNFLASGYARTRLAGGRKSLRGAIFEGIVIEILQTNEENGNTLEDVSAAVQDRLNITNADASDIARDSLDRLMAEGLCIIDSQNEGRYQWAGEVFTDSENRIDTLAQGVLDRYVVRFGGHTSKPLKECISEILERTMLTRGWDLGAAFASGKPASEIDLGRIFEEFNDELIEIGIDRPEQVLMSLRDLLNRPNSAESDILAELGRISFALELTLVAPQGTLFHTLTLPERIYLDANVLLPAFVKGHPFYDVYSKTIKRLVDAASMSQVDLEIVSIRGFLNEIVSHRKLSLESIRELGPGYRESIMREVQIYGSSNTNVFIGAYANTLVSQKDLSFEDFLADVAPYKNENELETWIKSQGVSVIRKAKAFDAKTPYAEILHHFEVSFAKHAGNINRSAIVIEHDAIQIAALETDWRNGRRSLFVTGDKRVGEIVASSDWRHLGNTMISRLGLVQLVDLLVGIDVNARSLVAMMWATSATTSAERIRNYLVDKALESYDEAQAMLMHEVLDEIVEDAQDRAELAGIDFDDGSSRGRTKVNRFFEDFEEKYFDGMRKTIELRRRQSDN